MITIPKLDVKTDFTFIRAPEGRVLKQLNKFNEITGGALDHPRGQVVFERGIDGKLSIEALHSDGKSLAIPVKKLSVDGDFMKYLGCLTRTAAQIGNSKTFKASIYSNNPYLERLIELGDTVAEEQLLAEMYGKTIPTEKDLQSIIRKKIKAKEGKDKEKKFLFDLVGVTNSRIKDADLVAVVLKNLGERTKRLEEFTERFKKYFEEYREEAQPILDKLNYFLDKFKALQSRFGGKVDLVDICPSIVSGGPKVDSKTGTQKRRIGTTYDIFEALSFEAVMAKKIMGSEDYFLGQKVPENA